MLYRLVRAKHMVEWEGLMQAAFVALCTAVLAVLALRLANCFSLKWVRTVGAHCLAPPPTSLSQS